MIINRWSNVGVIVMIYIHHQYDCDLVKHKWDHVSATEQEAAFKYRCVMNSSYRQDPFTARLVPSLL